MNISFIAVCRLEAPRSGSVTPAANGKPILGLDLVQIAEPP
jgi:hypothetical protein